MAFGAVPDAMRMCGQSMSIQQRTSKPGRRFILVRISALVNALPRLLAQNSFRTYPICFGFQSPKNFDGALKMLTTCNVACGQMACNLIADESFIIGHFAVNRLAKRFYPDFMRLSTLTLKPFA